ncbi:MAG: hypothetical protein ACRCX8_00565 [Sarcina sp.]
MKKFEGKTWGTLTSEEQNSLLATANVCNDANGEISEIEVIVI